MGLGIGYGRNDVDTLADAWRRKNEKTRPAGPPARDPVEEQRWASGIIEVITSAVRAAVPGQKQVEVGEFRSADLPPQMGEFYPTREQLKGGAQIIYDFCRQEGLYLFVGGDFKMSGRWDPPYEIIVRLEK